VGDFLIAKFPPITEDRQIQAMDGNMQSCGIKTIVNASFEPTFYKNVDLEDMLKYLLTIRKLDNKHVRDIVSYFRRFCDVFFGPQPEEILKLKASKRGWILQGMRHFGNYYYFKTNNPECKELIEKIINRYGLNIGLDMHQRIYIVDDNMSHIYNRQLYGKIGLESSFYHWTQRPLLALTAILFLHPLA
jgi:hypothetical protein